MDPVMKRICCFGRCMNEHSVLNKDCGAKHTLVVGSDQTIVCDGMRTGEYFVHTLHRQLPSPDYHFEESDTLLPSDMRVIKASATVFIHSNRENLRETIEYARRRPRNTLIVDIGSDASMSVGLADTLPNFKIARRLGEARERLAAFLAHSWGNGHTNINA